jgi:hypothetical protein
MNLKNMIHNFSSYLAISNNIEVNAVIKAGNDNNIYSVSVSLVGLRRPILLRREIFIVG